MLPRYNICEICVIVVYWNAPCGESKCIISVDVKCILTCIPVKVRMCAGVARLGESVGIRGRFERT